MACFFVFFELFAVIQEFCNRLSTVKLLTRLAMALWMRLTARCIDGEGTVQVRRGSHVDRATN